MRIFIPTLSLACLALGSAWPVGYAASPKSGALAAASSAIPTGQLGDSSANAAPIQGGLTVIGRASFPVTAARAEVRLQLKAAEEMAGAALRGLMASGARLTAAVESIEAGTVTLTRSGPRFRVEQAETMQSFVMGGMDQGNDEPPKVEALESFVLSISAPEEGTSLAALVAEVIEATADAGATLASSQQDPQMMMIGAMTGQDLGSSEPAVSFYPSSDDSRKAGISSALAKAREEGEMLAALANRQLGPVLGLREIGEVSGSLSAAGTETQSVAYEVRFDLH